MFENINEVAILVSAILAVALGNIWYSTMLFGSHWSRAADIPSGGVQEDSKTLFLNALKNVLVYLVIFFVVAKFIEVGDEVKSISALAITSLAILFLWAHLLIGVIWEQRPYAYFFIHAAYFGTVLLGGYAIISYWPW